MMDYSTRDLIAEMEDAFELEHVQAIDLLYGLIEDELCELPDEP